MATRDLSAKTPLTYTAATVQWNQVCWIDETHFMSATALISAWDSYVRTFSVAVDWTITEIDSLLIDGSMNAAYWQCMIKIDATHYALIYTQSDNDWIISILTIDGSYNITESWKYIYDSTAWLYSSMCLLDSTHIAISYSGYWSDWYVTIIVLSGSYEPLNYTALEHDTNNCISSSICKIDNTHFCIAYEWVSNDGYIKTFSTDGNYTVSNIYTLEHDTTNCQNPSVVLLDSTHLCLSYCGDSLDWFIKVFTIDWSYNLSQSSVLEHDTSDWLYNSLVKIDNTHVALAYNDTSSVICNLKIFTIAWDLSISQTNVVSCWWNWKWNSIDLLWWNIVLWSTDTDNYAKAQIITVELPVTITFTPRIIQF